MLGTSDDFLITVAWSIQRWSKTLWDTLEGARSILHCNSFEKSCKFQYFLIFYHGSIRNLTLGAKAEMAIGKEVATLEAETKKQLVQLLEGTSNESV